MYSYSSHQGWYQQAQITNAMEMIPKPVLFQARDSPPTPISPPIIDPPVTPEKVLKEISPVLMVHDGTRRVSKQK